MRAKVIHPHPPQVHPTTPLSHHHRHTQNPKSASKDFSIAMKDCNVDTNDYTHQSASKDCSVAVHHSQSWNQRCPTTLLRNLSSPPTPKVSSDAFPSLLVARDQRTHTNGATEDPSPRPSY
ncbi:Hypothetical predicted protein, partial [Olea europaea subsp. europaea]